MKKVSLLTISLGLLLGFNSCKAESSNQGGQSSTSKSVNLGGGIDLKFNLKPGNSYTYSTSMKQNTETMGMKSNNEMNTVYTYKVKEDDNGNLKLEVTYDKMSGNMEVMGKKTEFGLDKENKESEIYKTMAAKPFTMTVDKTGKIISVDNMSFSPKSPNMNKEDMKNLMELSLNIYPNRPVKIGDTWEKDSETKLMMLTMKIHSVYKLVSVDGDVATLEVSGDLKMNQNNEGEADLKGFSLSGTKEGTLKVNINSGMPVSGTINQKIKGEMGKQGKSIPMNMESQVTINGVEK